MDKEKKSAGNDSGHENTIANRACLCINYLLIVCLTCSFFLSFLSLLVYSTDDKYDIHRYIFFPFLSHAYRYFPNVLFFGFIQVFSSLVHFFFLKLRLIFPKSFIYT